jgi:hypothetical protein
MDALTMISTRDALQAGWSQAIGRREVESVFRRAVKDLVEAEGTSAIKLVWSVRQLKINVGARRAVLIE